MKSRDGRLILFARTPVPGRVKTRLAEDLGHAATYDIYCRVLEYMVAMTTQAGQGDVILAVWPDTHTEFLQRLSRDYPVTLMSQQGGDLGERMYHALASARKQAEFAILIGVDCVTLDAARLEQAAEMLRQGVPWVFNPARDGGYLLVGTSQPGRAVFDDIDWGSAKVMEQTRSRCQAAGLAWEELPTLYDIDTHADWLRLQRDYPRTYEQLIGENTPYERTAIR